jgi:mannose-6-phosphate isomerase-like protein (cupin superfamily)
VLALISPLKTWWRTQAALKSFRASTLGRRVAVRAPSDRAWSTLAPGFERALTLIDAGVPYQVARERRHDRTPDRARVREALNAGATVFLPQAHQVLPRVARLMVALRAALLGPQRAECSFLFLVDGRGREGMGLHHDGDVDGFWLQLEGRRTVTIGPAVPAGTPEDLDDATARDGTRGWRTLALPPGSLLYLPPRTPHQVVCHERSLALTLTWGAPRRAARSPAARARAMADWDVASGRAEPWPPPKSRTRLWTQVPVALASNGAGGGIAAMWTPEGRMPVPARARGLVSRLGSMPAMRMPRRRSPAIDGLVGLGVLADEELPLLIHPADPAALDGWRFA